MKKKDFEKRKREEIMKEEQRRMIIHKMWLSLEATTIY
jgi:hypothetical protein